MGSFPSLAASRLPFAAFKLFSGDFSCRLDTSWTEIFKTNNMSSCKGLPLNLVVRLGNYSRRNLLLDEKGEMEDICDGFLASPGVYHLKQDN